MRVFYYSLLFVAVCLVLPKEVSAQYADRKWAFGTGINFIDYTAPTTGKYFQLENFDPALNLSVHRYLSGAFSLSADLTLAQSIRYPAYDPKEFRPGLVDMSYLLNFKSNNGVLLKEDAFFAPYVMLGFGGSYVKDHPDVYVPLGAGVQFRLSRSVSLRTQFTYKKSLNQDHQNVSQVVSFVYNFRTAPEPPTLSSADTLNPASLMALMNLKDTDEDGIIDNHDVCPQIPGIVNLQGCPSSEALDLASLRSYEKDQMAARAEEPVLLAKKVDIKVPAPVIQEESNPETPAELVAITEVSAGLNISQNQNESYLDEIPKDNPLITSELSANSIFFETGSDNLSEESYAVLDKVASMLHSHPDAQLVVVGHADASGSENTNLVLSVMRAFNVKYYLVYTHGISQRRIVSNGLGEEEPSSDNETLLGRRENRRVDFELVF